jgi:hypothetical protein
MLSFNQHQTVLLRAANFVISIAKRFCKTRKCDFIAQPVKISITLPKCKILMYFSASTSSRIQPKGEI